MATHVEKKLKKNVIDDVRYKHKGFAVFMLTLFLWGPFVGITITLFWLTRHPYAQASYEWPKERIELVKQQLNMKD